jgi:hypothetical protein
VPVTIDFNGLVKFGPDVEWVDGIDDLACFLNRQVRFIHFLCTCIKHNDYIKIRCSCMIFLCLFCFFEISCLNHCVIFYLSDEFFLCILVLTFLMITFNKCKSMFFRFDYFVNPDPSAKFYRERKIILSKSERCREFFK